MRCLLLWHEQRLIFAAGAVSLPGSFPWLVHLTFRLYCSAAVEHTAALGGAHMKLMLY
jgi:hypothetical protein